MMPKDFMKVLENSLDCPEAVEEKVVETDTGETVIFMRSLESISSSLSGVDEQIVKLQNGLKCSSMESCSDSVPIKIRLKNVFNITKGTYVRKIHEEVIRSVRLMLPHETRDTVNINTTFILASTIYDDLLKKVRNFNFDVIYFNFLS